MRGGTAASGKNACDALGVERGNVRGRYFVHHQNVGLVRGLLGFGAGQAGQHTATHVTQVGGPLGQQLVVQGLLLLRRSFDFLHPGGFGAQSFLQTRLDFLAQRRVTQHGLMGGKDVADAGDLTLIDQRADLRMDLVQRHIQPLQFDHRRLAALGVVDHLRLAYQDRTDGDAGRSSNTIHQITRAQGGLLDGRLIGLRGDHRLLRLTRGR